jgi:hypothetical protein
VKTIAIVAIACAGVAACAPKVTPAPTPAASVAPPPAAQNPSPMVEHTRVHERLVKRELPGTVRTFAGPMGKPVEVWVPNAARALDSVDVVIHFFSAAWLPEQAVAALPHPTVAAVVNLGGGSGVYDRSFTDPAAFDSLLAGIARETSAATGHPVRIARVTLSAFSAGHGAVRVILRDPRHFARVHDVLLIDGMHTSYIPDRTPLASGGVVDSTNLVQFEAFARAAMRGEKRFLVMHSEIFPGTFVSTTESADWLLASLGLNQTPVLRWGPRGLQQLSEIRSGSFELMGFAGNSAPDHIDELHAMPEMLARLLGM